MMCASSLDGNGILSILAQAVVPEENGENWNFFLQHFPIAGMGRKLEFFISDRDKDLIYALQENFHKHRMQNVFVIFWRISKKYGEQLKQMVIKMACAYTLQEYETCRNTIEGCNNGKKYDRMD
jgi:hypothetical protein